VGRVSCPLQLSQLGATLLYASCQTLFCNSCQIQVHLTTSMRSSPFGFREMCSGSEEGSYLRLIDFVSLNSRLESHKEETRWSFFSTAASERRGGNLKDFKDFYLQAKARIWPSLSFVPCSLDSGMVTVQGYLAHKKTPPPRTLQ